MLGLIGTKLGMTHIFDAAGEMVPVTVVRTGPCTVVQVRTRERDGYDAVQLGFDVLEERKVTQAGARARGAVGQARLPHPSRVARG